MKELRSVYCTNVAGAARSYGVIALNLLALEPERCKEGIAMHDKSAWSGFALARRVHGRDSHA